VLLLSSLALVPLRAAPAAAVELVLSDMTYVGSEAGRPALTLAAERARIEQGSDIAHLEGVRLDAADAQGGSSLQMTCDRAVLDLDTSDFQAEGNVRGRTADGHRFQTEAAEFRHDERVVESRAPVDIVDPVGTHLEGTGFLYEVRNQRMKMRNAVVSEIQEPNG
jgi:LPS export ABC transporter protein LptC